MLFLLIASILAQNKVYHQKIRGVNLGGWLVGEPWITPTLFDTHDVPDEYSLGKKLGHDAASAYLKKHWESFYTEKDIQRIASWGVNMLRIPVGYWAFDSDPAPYATGQVEYLDKAVVWARKAGLKVLIDLHGGYGSQNGFDNSGRAGKAEWDPNDMRTPNVLKMIASRYARDNDTVVGIQGLNEPAPWALGLTQKEIAQFWRNGYKKIREHSLRKGPESIAFWLHDTFTSLGEWHGQFPKGTYPNLVMDRHHYEVFDANTMGSGVEFHINSVKNFAQENVKYEDENHKTVVGEWSGAITDCTKYLNGYKAGTRFEGTFPNSRKVGNCSDISIPIATWSRTRKNEARKFIEAQLDAYESSGGWIFWTAKTEAGPGTDAAWDMGLLIKHGIFPQPLNDRKFK